MQPAALKSMRRMCTAQVMNSNRASLAVHTGPATEALKRATKRRRVEDNKASLECTKVSKDFDLASVFAELPTTEEAFPSISWDFDDAFGSEAPMSAAVTAFSPLCGEKPSPLKRSRTANNTNGLVRSKTAKAFFPAMDVFAPAVDFDLDSEVRLARELGEAVMHRSGKLDTTCRQQEESTKGILLDFFKECQP